MSRARLGCVVSATLAVVLGAIVTAVAIGVTPVLNGYVAKTFGSSVFVSGREPEHVRAEDLGSFWIVTTEVDRDARAARASVFGLGERTAIHRPGLGVALVSERSEAEVRAQRAKPSAEAPRDAALGWPQGDGPAEAPATDVDVGQLNAAVDASFQEPDPEGRRRTRAVLVAHRGRLVAERYADGFGPHMPMQGWSMTKSLISALVGVLVDRGALRIDDSPAVAEWSAPDDPRRAITFDHLLRMSSGLEWREDYASPRSDVLEMLFLSPETGAYAAAKPLEHPPGTHWRYASGTSNLLARALRPAVGGSAEAYLDLPRSGLFARIGMTSAILETDASGHLVGSSFSHATARDWARFGQLYLQDGVWNGDRVLPAGWVDYTRAPAPAAPLGEYGAHFWLNAGPAGEPARRPMPTVPADAYSARGFQGQSVTIVPSRELVIVRLGLADLGAWELEPFLAAVTAAFPGGDVR